MRLPFVTITFAFLGLARGQQAPVLFSRSVVDDQLPSLRITCLAEDPNGGIWAGTPNGLACVIGDQVRTFLPSNDILCINASHWPDVWASTPQGIFRIHALTDEVSSFRCDLPGTDASRTRYVGSLAIDAKERVWCAASFGLLLFDAKSAKWSVPAFHMAGASDKPFYAVTSALELDPRNHVLWIGTSAGCIASVRI